MRTKAQCSTKQRPREISSIEARKAHLRKVFERDDPEEFLTVAEQAAVDIEAVVHIPDKDLAVWLAMMISRFFEGRFRTYEAGEDPPRRRSKKQSEDGLDELVAVLENARALYATEREQIIYPAWVQVANSGSRGCPPDFATAKLCVQKAHLQIDADLSALDEMIGRIKQLSTWGLPHKSQVSRPDLLCLGQEIWFQWNVWHLSSGLSRKIGHGSPLVRFADLVYGLLGYPSGEDGIIARLKRAKDRSVVAWPVKKGQTFVELDDLHAPHRIAWFALSEKRKNKS
jgi:hypothetical protein